MANSNSAREPQVPAALLKQHRATWHWFTQLIAAHVVGIAVFLFLMLLVFKIL